jgi:hypothetical protein
MNAPDVPLKLTAMSTLVAALFASNCTTGTVAFGALVFTDSVKWVRPPPPLGVALIH